MTARARGTRVPRRFRAGVAPAAHPGEALTVVTLARHGGEWFGVDLGSGAFVRVRDEAPDEPGTEERPRVAPRVATVEVSTAEPPDPARPEALAAASVTPHDALTPRRLRRLLRAVATPEHHGLLVLGTRAQSVAYASLDARTPSVELIALDAKRATLDCDGSGAELTFTWGDLTQTLGVLDAWVVAATAAADRKPVSVRGLGEALGTRLRYALCAFTEVQGGYAKKAVVTLL